MVLLLPAPASVRNELDQVQVQGTNRECSGRNWLESRRSIAKFESWIWSNLDTRMKSSKEVTLVDTQDIQANLNIMALANSTDNSFQKSGTFSSLREIISWKLSVSIQKTRDISRSSKPEPMMTKVHGDSFL